MLNSFFTLFWRNLRKNSVFSLLNIFGLALGFAGFIVSYQYINREISYDHWNSNYENIYLLGLTLHGNHTDQTPSSLAGTIQDNIPEIVRAGRKLNYFYGDYPIFGEQTVYVKKAVVIDSAAARIFQVESQHGPLYRSPEQHEATLVTEDLAKKLFRDDLSFNEPKKVPVMVLNMGMEETIYGVSQDKGYSVLDYDLLLIKEMGGESDLYTYQTYVQTRPGTDIKSLQRKINELYQNAIAKRSDVTASTFANGTIYLDPLANLHLRPKHGSNSSYLTIWLLGILSIVILTLAAANFTNLMLAQADKRSKEIAVKKVFGNTRTHIAGTFLLEVFLQVLLAATLSFIFLDLASNVFTRWYNDDLLTQLYNRTTALQLFAAVIFTTLISGVYPACILSGYRPARLLKGSLQNNPSRSGLRHGLLIFQFVIATVFITAVITVKQQIDFMHSSEKGFETGQVINFKSVGLYYDSKLDGSFQDFKNRLMQNQSIEYVAAASNIPGGTDAPPKKQFAHQNEKVEMDHIAVDLDYFKTLSIPTLKGTSDVSLQQLLTDSSARYAVINETAAKSLKLANPIGSKINGCKADFTVVGVVADSKTYGFENLVSPTIYSFKDECGPGHLKITLMVKAKDGKNQDAIIAVDEEWRKNPNAEALPLDYIFLDQQYAQLHARQESLGRALYSFTTLALLIALLGLFSMSVYHVHVLQREMSIRKILGASFHSIFIQLNKPFVKIIAIAIVLAVPISYLLLYIWLANFAYQVQLNPWAFFEAAILFMLISILTISYQAIKAAHGKPIDVLREE